MYIFTTLSKFLAPRTPILLLPSARNPDNLLAITDYQTEIFFSQSSSTVGGKKEQKTKEKNRKAIILENGLLVEVLLF